MTGKEHFEQAERLLDIDPAKAQVHATLALAAATWAVADDEARIAESDERLASAVDPDGSRLRIAARSL